ncbi:MAG: imidazole glycerol phosphate synthase subunit HisH [Candidatus Lokiarchaeota archaeon]|jgi:glutamine amidotransferase
MIVIIDYGTGNLCSIQKCIKRYYPNIIITKDIVLIEQARAIILPGVGAFGDAIKELKQSGLYNKLIERIHQIPTLGICLGMQLLFSQSQESHGIDGLNIIPGKVYRIKKTKSNLIKIPHTGWNRLIPTSKPYFHGYAYFNHSYYCCPIDKNIIISRVDHGTSIPIIILKDHVLGVQFHPEKSKKVGGEIFQYFISLIER